MPIPVTDPLTIPATTYTGWWILNTTIIAPDPASPAVAKVILVPYDPITGRLAPVNPTVVTINDIYGEASLDPTTGEQVKEAIIGLIGAVEAVGRQRGIL